MTASTKQLEEALRDPDQVFKSPADLLASTEFSRKQKIEILRHWAYDQLEMSVAEEENMQATQDSDNSALLDEIIQALRTLGADLSESKLTPSKQGDV